MAAAAMATVLLLAAAMANAATAPQCSESGCHPEEDEEAGLLQTASPTRRNATAKIAIFTTGGSEQLACGCPKPDEHRCGIGRRDDNRTLQMAMAVKEGALEYCPDCQVDVYDIRFEGNCPDYPTVAETYDGIILGSAVWQSLPSPDILSYTSQWSRKGQTFSCKVGAAFATGGAVYAGLETSIRTLHARLMTFQMIMVGGPDWMVSPGAGAVTEMGVYTTDKGDSRAVGGDPTYEDSEFKPVDDMFLSQGKALGYRVATVTKAAKSAGLTDGSLCEAYPGLKTTSE